MRLSSLKWIQNPGPSLFNHTGMKNVLTGVRIELGVSGADSFETDKSQNPKESILHGYEHYCLRLLFEGNLHMRNRKYFFIADLSYIFS